MPKEQTHFMLARRAAKAAAGGAVGRALARAPRLYLLGSVIMDTPLYALAEKDLCFPLTERLHGQNGENPFEDAARVLAEWGPVHPDAALSFCLGVVSHVMADAAFHPFVFYLSGNCFHPLDAVRAACLARHRRIETLLDTLFLRNGARARTVYGLAAGAEAPAADVRGMAASLFGVSGTGWSGRVKHMMASHGILQLLFLQHPISRLMHLCAKFYYEKLSGFDALFYPYDHKMPRLSPERLLRYRHPVTGVSREATLNRMADRAVRSTVEIFGRVSRAASPAEAAEVLACIRAPSPETGLPGVGAAEMKYFDAEVDIEALFGLS